MKLVDILARELKMWPADGCSIHQGVRGNLFTVQNGCLAMEVEKADDWLSAEVARAQWQAAVDALNSEQCAHDYANKYGCPECGEAASPAWDGEGRPPILVPVEYQRRGAPNGKWYPTQINFLSGQHVIFCDSDGDEIRENPGDILFRPIRPIRTPEQLAAESREFTIKQFMQIGEIYYCDAEKLYDAGARIVTEDKP